MAPRIYSRMRASGEGRQTILGVIERWEELAETCMAFLREAVRFTMVTIPEALAVEQLKRLRERYGHLPVVTLPLFPYELRGLERLEEAARILEPETERADA